jgi:hypothetical protein
MVCLKCRKTQRWNCKWLDINKERAYKKLINYVKVADLRNADEYAAYDKM